MKKEIFAIITILLLIVASLINIFHLNNLIDSMTTHINAAIFALNVGDISIAESELNNALKIWLNSSKYTHVFIRHTEIDAITDAYFDALAAIKSENNSAITLIEQTKYHLESILSIEKLSLESVL